MKKISFLLLFSLFTLITNAAHAANKTIGIIVYDGVLTSDITGL